MRLVKDTANPAVYPIVERGAGLPEKDRKRLAAKAVREIMETI